MVEFKKYLKRSPTQFSSDSQESKSSCSSRLGRMSQKSTEASPNDTGQVFVYDIARCQTLTMPKKELLDKIGDNPKNLQKIKIESNSVPVYLSSDDEHQEWFASVHIPAKIRLQRALHNHGNFDTLYVACF